MNGTNLSFLALLAALSWSDSAAARGGGAERETGGQPAAASDAEVLLLAQAREVEIVIDQYGRELIVDAYTGEVLAVRRERGMAPAERRYERQRELGREPLGERLDRELEILLGRREAPPRGFDPEFRQRPYPDNYDSRAFPPPPGREDYRDAAPAPRIEAAPAPPVPSPVERRPLNQDGSEGSIAALPDASEEGLIIEEPSRPDITAPPIVHGGASEDVAKFQILLDRMGARPGVIDGRMGDNVNKALTAYREITGRALRTYDKDAIQEALMETGGEAFKEYEITPTDAAGPFLASVPEDYGEKAQLERLGYTSVSEKLAERFHMDERYLKALNPGVNFDRPGTIIRVANVGQPLRGEVERIVADKSAKQVFVYGAGGSLIAAYPATIGSTSTPSPSGTVTVERIALNPEYTYNPRINFQQGTNDRVLTIPPGPNGPVGSVWIALSKPTYGIHGTPEPSQIGKTYSHGCVRLTNWDAEELAKMVKPGVVVEFRE